jgi:acylphosphatase
VQGVGYRFFAQRAAEKLGVCGFARNLQDGRVEVMATGSEEQLESMRKQLERGPRFSKVSGVQEVEAQREAQREPLHENAFVIAPDA